MKQFKKRKKDKEEGEGKKVKKEVMNLIKCPYIYIYIRNYVLELLYMIFSYIFIYFIYDLDCVIVLSTYLLSSPPSCHIIYFASSSECKQ